MSKELPYYQFEVAEYLAGDIMICSLEAQGLFTIIKCLYWQKNCTLKLSQILKRYDKQNLIDELVNENCIKIEDDYIIISFLDTQHVERTKKHQILSESGRKGARIREQNKLKNMGGLKGGLPTHKHIEENREDENKIEENKVKDILLPENSFSEDVIKCYESCLEFFPSHLRPSKPSEIKKWQDCVDKLQRLDKVPLNWIVEIVKRTREDDFWSNNFLSLLKLRKKDKVGVKYIQVFYAKFGEQKNNNGGATSSLRQETAEKLSGVRNSSNS